jgi:hypothetical protein
MEAGADTFTEAIFVAVVVAEARAGVRTDRSEPAVLRVTDAGGRRMAAAGLRSVARSCATSQRYSTGCRPGLPRLPAMPRGAAGGAGGGGGGGALHGSLMPVRSSKSIGSRINTGRTKRRTL